MRSTIRKNITLSSEDYDTISAFAKKQGLSFSEFLRNSALNVAKKSEDIDLLDFIISNCKYVDKQEHKEIDDMDINFDNLKGKALTLDEIIQS